MPVHKRRVDKWCRRTARLSEMLRHHANEYTHMSGTYAGIRDMAFDYPEGMEKADELYVELTDAKNALCELQAGGARRTRHSRKSRRGRKTRRHY